MAIILKMTETTKITNKKIKDIGFIANKIFESENPKTASLPFLPIEQLKLLYCVSYSINK